MGTQIAYKNTSNGEVYVFDEARPDLDARGNFERVADPGEIPQSALDALARARAERESIAAAAKTVAQRVEAQSTEVTTAAAAVATSVPEPTAAMTGAHLAPDVENPVQGVLARGHTPGALQIGPDPEAHPRTLADLEAQAARDSEELATKGVLARAADSRRRGGEQVGNPADRHPSTTAEKHAAAAKATGTLASAPTVAERDAAGKKAAKAPKA